MKAKLLLIASVLAANVALADTTVYGKINSSVLKLE